MHCAWSSLLFFFIVNDAVGAVDNVTYFANRQALLDEDASYMIGAGLTLNSEEISLNDILMGYKNADMDTAFETLEFPPSESFFTAKDKIDQSEVFSIIKDMPKGSVLHAHDMGLVAVEWLVSELTYWDDLYMCNQTGSPLLFKFFDTPDATCPWELVANARAAHSSIAEFDRELQESMSFIESKPEDYLNINEVWSDFEGNFATLSGLLSYHPAWDTYMQRVFYEYMMDNVLYLEMRGVLPRLYEKNGTEFTDMQTFDVYDKAVKNFTATYPNDFFGFRFIYAPHKSLESAALWDAVNLLLELREAYPDIVAGFDLVGQEDAYTLLIDAIDQLLFLANQDPPVSVFYHAGETNWHSLGPDENLFDAILLNTTRIGHSYSITKHPALMQRALDNNIAFEVCPVSNQVLMLVDDLRNHPMAGLVAQNFPIVISSDDNGIWGADPLSHDFYEAFYGLGGAKADLKFLKQLAMNSIEYTSLPDAEKQSLLAMWQEKWDEFIVSTLAKHWS